MENKKNIRIFNTIILLITIVTLCLSILYNSAFIPSFILMFSLFLFGICYYIKNERKTLMYILFTVGILLIFTALTYTLLRLI